MKIRRFLESQNNNNNNNNNNITEIELANLLFDIEDDGHEINIFNMNYNLIYSTKNSIYTYNKLSEKNMHNNFKIEIHINNKNINGLSSILEKVKNISNTLYNFQIVLRNLSIDSKPFTEEYCPSSITLFFIKKEK
jgi:hypothetical protein